MLVIEYDENLGGNAVGIAVYFAIGEMDEPLMAHQKGVAPLVGRRLFCLAGHRARFEPAEDRALSAEGNILNTQNREGLIPKDDLFSSPTATWMEEPRSRYACAPVGRGDLLSKTVGLGGEPLMAHQNGAPTLCGGCRFCVALPSLHSFSHFLKNILDENLTGH